MIVFAQWLAVCLAAPSRPAASDLFFVTPHQQAQLSWRPEGVEEPAPFEYELEDYEGHLVQKGRTHPTPEGALQAEVHLPQGYFELVSSATGERYGIVSLPPARQPDPFFAIDAAMSWLVPENTVREGLVRALRRCGIAMARERVRWGDVQPQPDRWEWETPRHYERLRQTYRAHGVEVLEMWHDTPDWTGRVGKYPDDLVATARSWREIGRRWQATWNGLDVWNEPDISFGDWLPADQYVPLVKTVAYAFACEAVTVPLVGAVMAHYERAFLDNAAQNGLLDLCEAVSFHTYGHAPQMELLVGQYREWLIAWERPSMPLWITECGRPWKRGPGRPPREQDAESALDITMKAVEARACGIERYFAFVYPYYEERENNFGMMGREATPLRSMAAYARLASLLAGMDYRGDLPCDDPAIQRARVFGDAQQTVAVLYTGKAEAGQSIRLPLSPRHVEGIDGRALCLTEDGSVPIPDGLTYVWLEGEHVRSLIHSDTEAMRLWQVARQPQRDRGNAAPLVLRFQPDTTLLEPKTQGYRLKGDWPQRLPLRVRVFNLSDGAQHLSLTPRIQARQTLDLRTLSIPPGAFIDATWEVEPRAWVNETGRLEVTWTATAIAGERVLPLHIMIMP